MQNQIQSYLNKKNCIGILGTGLSGQGAAALCRKFSIPYEILEEHKDEIFIPSFKKYGICVFSPGFPPHHSWWRQAQEAGCLCINEIDFAALFIDNPLIAVTGTNGKTSTVELITQVLNAWGKTACAVGNNGNVLSLEVAKNDADTSKIYVCEISSYQAWPLKFFKPHYSLWTNFAPDHIIYHGNLNNYFAAKKHLLECTQETCFCSHTLEHDLPDLPKVIFAQNPQFYTNWLDNFPVCFSYGQRENFTLVRFFAEKIGIPLNVINECFKKFVPPKHRLHRCGLRDKMSFWNDSKGTNLHAVHAALESLKHHPHLHWILGGGAKGEELKTFVSIINRYPIEKIYLIGETGKQLYSLKDQFHAETIFCSTLKNVFNFLPEKKNFTLVLSPGFTSWDQYSNFEERGTEFEACVRNYLDKKSQFLSE